MSALVLVEGPESFPVTLDEAKRHLRVNFSDDDELITAYIGAATAWAESFMGRALVGQTYDYFIDEFPDGPIQLPRPPLIHVEEFVSPVGGDSFANYSVDYSRDPARLYVPNGGEWPSLTYDDGANAARIRFRAGYFDDTDSPAYEGAYNGSIPDDIRCAILIYVANLYANRESIVIGVSATEVPWSAEALLRRHRVETSLA